MLKVVFVCKDFSENNFHLQPWYFIYGLSTGLCELGHDVSIVTNASNKNLKKIQLFQCNSFSSKEIAGTINRLQPHLIVWNYGVTSAIKFLINKSLRKYKSTAVFTSPKYSVLQILNALKIIGLRNAIKSVDSMVIHVIGILIPWFLIRLNLKLNNINSIIVLSSMAKKRLTGSGIKSSMLLPTVNLDFETYPTVNNLKEEFGLPKDSLLVLYAGNPVPLRGSQWLIESFIQARKYNPNLYLILLLRTERSFENYIDDIKYKIKKERLEPYIVIIDRSLSITDLKKFYGAADIVVLPFILVPSEAPFTIMEVHQLGRPVIVSDIAGLPDMALSGDIIIKPNNRLSLIRALLNGNWSNPNKVTFKAWKEIAQEFLQHTSK